MRTPGSINPIFALAPAKAVEVTKLSLLLKVLEDETQQNLQRDFLAERQRILPDLGHHIRCGNSLIGPDFYDPPGLPELDAETRYRIHVFDWNTAFLEVFARGGFDCVIGNPPYVRIQPMKEWAPVEVEIYKHATCTFPALAGGNPRHPGFKVKKTLTTLQDHLAAGPSQSALLVSVGE